MFEKYTLTKADHIYSSSIWHILKQAIKKRKLEGSKQWQDGYPNENIIKNDIENGYGYVCLNEKKEIVAYIALIFDIEPAYENIEGKWLSSPETPYAVIHRLAVSQENPVKGLATWIMQEIEKFCKEKDIYSIKVDTNYDNIGMLRVFEKLDYTYCGEVYFRGGARKAFEKILA